MQPGRHVGQDARETQVVLWGRLGQRGKVDVCPELEPDARWLVRAKGEWIRNDLWRFDGNGLEEVQDVVAFVCDGDQRLGGGLLRLTCLRFRVLGLNGADAIIVVGPICLACGLFFLRPLRDGAGKNIEELARVQLAIEDRGLRHKWREEDGVARNPVPLLFRARKVGGGGAKEDFRDR